MANQISATKVENVLKQHKLLKSVCFYDWFAAAPKDYEYLSFDSNDVKPNTLFFCKGASFKASYAQEAIESGATAIVSEKAFDNLNICTYVVSDIRQAMVCIAAAFYSNSGIDKMKLIGITGTKGKTTTTLMLAAIMEQASEMTETPRPAVISSIYTSDGVNREEAQLTTPETFTLYRVLAQAAENGAKFGVVEISSQAFKTHRIGLLSFDYGVWLNIGEDHISPIEHSDFADYFNAKLRLFDHAKSVLINAETYCIQEILAYLSAPDRYCRKRIGFSAERCSDVAYSLKDQTPWLNGQALTIETPNGNIKLNIPLIGDFNACNAIAAVAVATELALPIQAIVKGLESVVVEGRTEILVSEDNNLIAVVDFAHNKLSFEALFRELKSTYNGYEIRVVFGCPGGKAYNRRHELPEVAGACADVIYFTTDDTGNDDFAEICDEVHPYLAESEVDYEMIEDRREAVEKAFSNVNTKTVVAMLGKGREKFQKVKGGYEPYESDFALAQEMMRQYNYTYRLSKQLEKQERELDPQKSSNRSLGLSR